MKLSLQPPPTLNPFPLSSSGITAQQFGEPPRPLLCTHMLFGFVCFTYMDMTSTLQYVHGTEKSDTMGK